MLVDLTMPRPCRLASLLITVVLCALPLAARANAYAVGEVPRMIPEREALKLHAAQVFVTDDLLRQGASPSARKQLARKTGLRAARVDQLCRYADLLRLQNIGPEWVMLLEAAGVRSIPDLALKSAPELTRKIETINRTRRIADPGPSEAQLRDWIGQAAKLPAMLSPS